MAKAILTGQTINNAGFIDYDNSGSGMAAANVQRAVDEIKSDFNTHIAKFMPHGVDNAGFKNSIFRGKSIGTSVTTEQRQAIANGSFKDLWLGDYWTINSRVYRIAAFNYYKNTGDTETTANHITIVPDLGFYTAKMNETNITDGGYIGSVMYTTNLASAISTIEADFPSMVLEHARYLSNAVTSGDASAGAWFSRKVDLMNEVMVYGSVVNGNRKGADGYGLFNIGIEKTQLPLFAYAPEFITTRTSWWLRDVISASAFARVASDGRADRNTASYSYEVRPAFSIY